MQETTYQTPDEKVLTRDSSPSFPSSTRSLEDEIWTTSNRADLARSLELVAKTPDVHVGQVRSWHRAEASSSDRESWRSFAHALAGAALELILELRKSGGFRLARTSLSSMETPYIPEAQLGGHANKIIRALEGPEPWTTLREAVETTALGSAGREIQRVSDELGIENAGVTNVGKNDVVVFRAGQRLNPTEYDRINGQLEELQKRIGAKCILVGPDILVSVLKSEGARS